MKSDQRISSDSDKVKNPLATNEDASRMDSKYLNKVEASQETVENSMRNKKVSNANSGVIIHNKKDLPNDLNNTNLLSSQEQTMILPESSLHDVTENYANCPYSVETSFYGNKRLHSKEINQGSSDRSVISEQVCIELDLKSTVNHKEETTVNLNTSPILNQLKSPEGSKSMNTYCENHMDTHNQPCRDFRDEINRITIYDSDDQPCGDDEMDGDVSEPNSDQQFSDHCHHSIIYNQQNFSSQFGIDSKLNELSNCDQPSSHDHTKHDDPLTRIIHKSNRQEGHVHDEFASDSPITTDNELAILKESTCQNTIDIQPCSNRRTGNGDDFKGSSLLPKTETQMASHSEKTFPENDKWKDVVIRNHKAFKQHIPRKDLQDKSNRLTFHHSEGNHRKEIQFIADYQTSVDNQLDHDNQSGRNNQFNNNHHHSRTDDQQNFSDQFAVDARLKSLSSCDQPSSHDQTRSNNPQASSNKKKHKPDHVYCSSSNQNQITANNQLDICSQSTCQSPDTIQTFINKTVGNKGDPKGDSLVLRNEGQVGSSSEYTWPTNEERKNNVEEIMENNGKEEVIKDRTNQLTIHGCDDSHNNELQFTIDKQSNVDGQSDRNLNQPRGNNHLDNDHHHSIIINKESVSNQFFNDAWLTETNNCDQPSCGDQTRGNDSLPSIILKSSHQPSHVRDQSASNGEITTDNQSSLNDEPMSQTITDILPCINKTMGKTDDFKGGSLLLKTEYRVDSASSCTVEGNDKQKDIVEGVIKDNEVFDQDTLRNEKCINFIDEKVIFLDHSYAKPSNERSSVHDPVAADILPSNKNQPTKDSQSTVNGLGNVEKKPNAVYVFDDNQFCKPAINNRTRSDNLQNIEKNPYTITCPSNDNQPTKGNHQLNIDIQAVNSCFFNGGKTSAVNNLYESRCPTSVNRHNDYDKQEDSCPPSNKILSNSIIRPDVVHPPAAPYLWSDITLLDGGINLTGYGNLSGGGSLPGNYTLPGNNNIPDYTNEPDSFYLPENNNLAGRYIAPGGNDPPSWSDPPGSNITTSDLNSTSKSGNVPHITSLPSDERQPGHSSFPGTSDSSVISILDSNHPVSCYGFRRDFPGFDVVFHDSNNVNDRSVISSDVNVTDSFHQPDTSSGYLERHLIDNSGNDKKVLLLNCKTSQDANRSCSFTSSNKATCVVPTVETQKKDNLASSNNSTLRSKSEDDTFQNISVFDDSPLLFDSPEEFLRSFSERNYHASREESFEGEEANVDNSFDAGYVKSKKDFRKEKAKDMHDFYESKSENLKDSSLNTNLNHKDYNRPKHCPFETISAVLPGASFPVQSYEPVSNLQKDNTDYVRDSQKILAEATNVCRHDTDKYKENVKVPELYESLVASSVTSTGDITRSCLAQMNNSAPEESAPCMQRNFFVVRPNSDAMPRIKPESQELYEIASSTITYQVSQKVTFKEDSTSLTTESEREHHVRPIKLEEDDSVNNVFEVSSKILNKEFPKNEFKSENEAHWSNEQAVLPENDNIKQSKFTEIISRENHEKCVQEFNNTLSTFVPLCRSREGEQILKTTVGQSEDRSKGNTTQFKDCFSQTSFSESVSQDSRDTSSPSTNQSFFYGTQSGEDSTFFSSSETSYEVCADAKAVSAKKSSLNDTDSGLKNVDAPALRRDINADFAELSNEGLFVKNGTNISVSSLNEPNPCALAVFEDASVHEHPRSGNVVAATVKRSRRRLRQTSSESDEENKIHCTRKKIRPSCGKNYSPHSDKKKSNNSVNKKKFRKQSEILKSEDDFGLNRYFRNLRKNNSDRRNRTSNERRTGFARTATEGRATESVNNQILLKKSTYPYCRLKRSAEPDSSSSDEELDTKLTDRMRDIKCSRVRPTSSGVCFKVAGSSPCYSDHTEFDCKYERACDDSVQNSQQESTASENDVLPELNNRGGMKKANTGRNSQRLSRALLVLRGVKQRSSNTLRTEKIQFLDCVVKLRKLTVR